ncbi:MAG: hypothetical protein ACLFP4_14405, partial [Spirochaetales bacterium]
MGRRRTDERAVYPPALCKAGRAPVDRLLLAPDQFGSFNEIDVVHHREPGDGKYGADLLQRDARPPRDHIH